MSSSSPEPTLAVATGILGNPTETGARRHLAMLFGGRTVALAERRFPGFRSPRPALVLNELDAGPLAWLEQELGKAVQSRRYQSSGVPFGRRRAALEAFLRAQGVRAILGEFGHIGCNLAPIGQAMGIPVFTYFRGFDASKRLREPRILRRYRAAMPRLAGVFSVSQFLLDNLAEAGINHPNAVVIPTGVDTRAFVPGDKDPHLILAVGRIVAKKAPMVTLKAFAEVSAAFPEHRLEVIGDGEMRGECEAWAEQSGLGGRIAFLGRRDHDVVRERLSRATIFLQHSITAEDGNTEGLPTAIQEAMASGCAVVSTRHAGIPEAVEEGRTGLLVDEFDGEGFAAALRRVLASPEGAAEMGRAARETAVERFDFLKLHARLEATIRQTCQQLGVPAP